MKKTKNCFIMMCVATVWALILGGCSDRQDPLETIPVEGRSEEPEREEQEREEQGEPETESSSAFPEADTEDLAETTATEPEVVWGDC